MIYQANSTLLRRHLIARITTPTDTCPDNLLEDSWKDINRQWKKDLRAVYMGCTTLLLAILKPLESWTPRLQNVQMPEVAQKLLQDKCTELAANCVEELRLAAEDDYPSDTVAAAVHICATLLTLKNLCREFGVPKLERRRWAVRSD
jgi:hypothetical protein